jgi:hypothetical protein
MQTAEAKDWPLFIGRLLQVILGASLDKRAALSSGTPKNI